MQDKNNSLFTKWVLNDQYYHRLIAISLLMLILILVLIFNTIDPVEHSKEYKRYRSKPMDEKNR
jgi:hypothetical protein